MSNNRKQKSKSFIKQKSNYESWLLRSSDAAIQASQDEAKQAAEQGQQKYQREAQKHLYIQMKKFVQLETK